MTKARNLADLLNADGQIDNADIAGGVNFKNIIINGDMSIAQRGTSETNATTGYQTVDRWKLSKSVTASFDMAQSTDVPSGQGFSSSLKMDCTTANTSLGAGNVLYLSQAFEGQNLQYLKFGTSNAQQLTLSFWVKSNKTGTYIAELVDTDNSLQVSNAYTINTANAWEKKTLTYPANTSNSFDNDNNRSLDIFFFLLAGSTFTTGTLQTDWGSTSADRLVGQVNFADSTANEWYITGVQLEAGTTASDFEFLPHDVNLRRCMRYFEKVSSSYPALAAGGKGDSSGYSVIFKERKRATPTMSDAIVRNGRTGDAVVVSNSTSGWTTVDFARYPTSQTNGSIGDGMHLYATSGLLLADAEL